MRRVALVVSAALLAACGTGPAQTSTAAPADSAAVAAPAGSGGSSNPAASAPARASGALGLGERRNEGGGVEVIAEWASPEPPSLKLTLDTHSVDLDRFDLGTAAKLRLDGGDWTAPTAAEVPKGGHHRAGTLTFGSIAPAAFASARVIELRVSEIAVPERLLRWERG